MFYTRQSVIQSFVTAGLGILILCASIGQTQTQNPPQSPDSEVGWLEHWRLSTFSFGKVDKQNGRDFFKVVGTGIVVTTDGNKAYIVTAKHVLDDPKENWHPSEIRLRFAWQEQKSVFDEHGILLKLLDSSGKPRWLASEDGADLAAMPFAVTELKGTTTEPHAIYESDISSPEDIFEGASVLVLGYPGIVGNEYLVRAISRGGIIAWLDPKKPYEKPFLIDANIYPGNSGGPVLRLPTGVNKVGQYVIGGKVTLLGIVSKAPGQEMEQNFTLQVPGAFQPQSLHLKQSIPLGGTGIIEPALKILSILKRLSAR